MTISPIPRRKPRADPAGFTLVEVLLATAISALMLAAILSANFHLTRSSVRAVNYAELEPPIRRGIEALASDLRAASGLVWNGPSDLTLTVPDSAGATRQVTYAWTSASAAFFRVAGADSTVTAGRLYLIRGVPVAANGTSGVVFERLDRLGATATTNLLTKQIRLRVTAVRGAGSGAAATRYESAVFLLRNKRDT